MIELVAALLAGGSFALYLRKKRLQSNNSPGETITPNGVIEEPAPTPVVTEPEPTVPPVVETPAPPPPVPVDKNTASSGLKIYMYEYCPFSWPADGKVGDIFKIRSKEGSRATPKFLLTSDRTGKSFYCSGYYLGQYFAYVNPPSNLIAVSV